MITLDELRTFLDTYLNFDTNLRASAIDPYMSNGLMVRGNEEVKTVGFAVSASNAIFEKARKQKCQAVVVHHSFNLPPYNRYDRLFQERIGYFLEHKMSLFGYHFLLDAHPQAGNNAVILQAMGVTPIEPYFFHGNPWGWIGEYKTPQPFSSVLKLFLPKVDKHALVYDFGPKDVSRVAAVSGKGAPYASDMQYLLDRNIDLYITGEAHEWNREMFRELGIHFVAGGHYATETFGIKALMKKVEAQFPSVRTRFLELHNSV